MSTIDNRQDTLDSRDIIDRIAELEDTRDSLQEDYTTSEGEDRETSKAALDAFDSGEEAEELRILTALQDEARGYSPDWTHGSQLIRESFFEEAMDEMVSECYTLPDDMPYWMSLKLDYDALKQDYTEIDFDGVTYYVR